MSDNLANTIGLRLAVRYLRQIELESEDPELGEDVDINRGPFGVFRSRQVPPSFSTHDHEDDTVEDILISNTGDPSAQGDITLTESGRQSPATQALVAAINGQSESLDILFSDSWEMSPGFGRVEEIFDLGSAPEDLDLSMPSALPQWQYSSYHEISSPSRSPSLPSPRPVLSSTVSPDAVQLLSHFTTTVVNLLTPFRHTKTPWHILFVPHVKNCLAALAMGEQLDHASLCVFHGTLALAATSMSGLSITTTWSERADLHKQQARHHASAMLKRAYDLPKAFKYKSILMALIMMIQVSLFSRARMEEEHYFLEAEKFIRLRGLNRRKSRKIRLLHHCYVFERLFHESTVGSAAGLLNRRTDLFQAVASSGVIVNGQDSPDFQLPDLNNLEQSLTRVKDQELGENDLHLAYPGDFPATLYPEVAAVPESYMLLLSLIIRLGKAKNASESLPHVIPLSTQEFLAQAKHVERAILRSRPALQMNENTHLPTPQDSQVLQDMLLAMYNALLIYFYRRIYDLDACLLQERVKVVCECLLRCEAADQEALYGSTGFKWPAFIAACEAEESETQHSFALLFRRLSQRSGFSAFAESLQDIEQVWREKQQPGGASVSWLDILRRRAGSLG